MQLYVICLMQLYVLYALDVFWSNLMFIKNRTCVKNEMGGGGGSKIFDMEFGGVFKIKVLLLEVVSRKSEMLRISHPPHPSLPLLMTSPLVPHSGNSAMKWLSFTFSSYRVQNANIILNIPYIHSPALPPFTLPGLMTRSQQRHSWLSW